MARRPQYPPDFSQMELLWNLGSAKTAHSPSWTEDETNLPEGLNLDDLELEDMELDAMEELTPETADAWVEETRQLFEHEGSDEALYERVVQAIYVLCDRIGRDSGDR